MNQTKKPTSEHTPEPWRIGKMEAASDVNEWRTTILQPNGGCLGTFITFGTYPRGEAEATAERIVACVNALAGLNPDAVKDVVESLEHLLDDGAATICSRVSIHKAHAALAKLKGLS